MDMSLVAGSTTGIVVLSTVTGIFCQTRLPAFLALLAIRDRSVQWSGPSKALTAVCGGLSDSPDIGRDDPVAAWLALQRRERDAGEKRFCDMRSGRRTAFTSGNSTAVTRMPFTLPPRASRRRTTIFRVEHLRTDSVGTPPDAFPPGRFPSLRTWRRRPKHAETNRHWTASVHGLTSGKPNTFATDMPFNAGPFNEQNRSHRAD